MTKKDPKIFDEIYDPKKIVALLIDSVWIQINVGSYREFKVGDQEFFIATQSSYCPTLFETILKVNVLGDTKYIKAMKSIQ